MALSKQKLYTVKEFDDFIGLAENEDRLFELINGEIVEKVPTEEHSLIVGNLYLLLRLFAEKRDLGRVAFEVRRKLPDDEHNARLPDVEFTAKERLLPVVKKGAVPQMPDLAVDIKSPGDKLNRMREKAAYYLANGTKLVWLVYPEKRLVYVIASDDEDVLTDSDTLTGGDVLPEFAVPVKDIFAGT